MATITYRKVNEHSWSNNTFLHCYNGCVAKLTEYKNGRMDIKVGGSFIPNVDGRYVSQYNGWNYTVKKLLGKPLKIKNYMYIHAFEDFRK